MLSNWHPYQGRIGDRMNWESEKQPSRWLPTITTSWYSFLCVSSPWIKAGHCYTLLMNRMWQMLKSHFHDMIPSWLPSWASILGIFPCPLTSSFYGKPAALLRVHMGKKKKVSSLARNWGPQSNNPKELNSAHSHVNDLGSRSLPNKSLDRLQPSERTWVRVSK